MRVYRVTHKDSGKVYIGATRRSLDERMARHFMAALHDEKPCAFYDALRAGGINAFTWDTIHDCGSEEEMWRVEREAIASYDCMFPNGYNQTRGGIGGGWKLGRKRGPMSEAERRKRSIAQKGRVASNRGTRHTFAAREKMRARVPWNKGVARTDVEKAKIRQSIRDSKVHGDNHPQCKAVECDGVIYRSVREMERRTGLSRAGIYYRLSKGRAKFVA